ncbi:MAG: endonuclease/exonuclease/phosphatase family protein, partial [Bradymonadaceae bacterium]
MAVALIAAGVGLAAAVGCRSPRGSDAHRPGPATQGADQRPAPPTPEGVVRIATYNTALSGDSPDAMVDALANPESTQPQRIASVLRIVRPDIVLLQEFDHRPSSGAPALFRRHFLSEPKDGRDALSYAHSLYPEVNTGVASGHDLDGNGRTVTTPQSRGYAGDALGWGKYPGHYGMLVLSRHPIASEDVRSFRSFEWRRMPNNSMPEGFYTEAERAMLPLSSKTHLDVPIVIDGRRLHLLISHPTPPAFDGPADRNGRRNRDEIRFWADYLGGTTSERGGYMVDEEGRRGGLDRTAPFVLLGDLNADPNDSADRARGAIRTLLSHERVADPRPAGPGGRHAAQRQGG